MDVHWRSVAGTLIHDITLSLSLSLSLSLFLQHILSHLPRKFLDDWERNWILINKFRHRIVMENICPRVHFENRLDVKILINSFLFCFLNEFLSRASTSPLLLILANGSHFLLHFFLIFLHRNYASLCDTLTRMEGLITNNSASRAVSWPTFNFLYFDNFRDVWEFIFQPCLNVLQPNFPLKCISLQK